MNYIDRLKTKFFKKEKLSDFEYFQLFLLSEISYSLYYKRLSELGALRKHLSELYANGANRRDTKELRRQVRKIEKTLFYQIFSYYYYNYNYFPCRYNKNYYYKIVSDCIKNIYKLDYAPDKVISFLSSLPKDELNVFMLKLNKYLCLM